MSKLIKLGSALAAFALTFVGIVSLNVSPAHADEPLVNCENFTTFITFAGNDVTCSNNTLYIVGDAVLTKAYYSGLSLVMHSGNLTSRWNGVILANAIIDGGTIYDYDVVSLGDIIISGDAEVKRGYLCADKTVKISTSGTVNIDNAVGIQGITLNERTTVKTRIYGDGDIHLGGATINGTILTRNGDIHLERGIVTGTVETWDGDVYVEGATVDLDKITVPEGHKIDTATPAVS